MQPDTAVVRDRMQQTFSWRRREIADGMTVEATLTKYPFLRTPLGVITKLILNYTEVHHTVNDRNGFHDLRLIILGGCL